MSLRVLTVCHAGRDPQHRERERALSALGVEQTLVMPASWSEAGAERELTHEPFAIVELPINRPGDVNRHTYAEDRRIVGLLAEFAADVLDIHEEPYSLAARQWLRAAPPKTPVVMYTGQNIDKRYPPPFAGYERAALQRANGLYPCCRQAASVARGKGFAGQVSVLPLGYDPEVFTVGDQAVESEVLTLMLAGRFVPEKGIEDAIRVLEQLNRVRPARLLLVGEGPMAAPARRLAAALGLAGRLELIDWQREAALAALYREAHVVLVPSHSTYTWVEQFGRVITEAQASGAIVAGYASGAIPEVAGSAGLLVEEGATDSLIEGVIALLGDPAEFARRRSAGRAQVAMRTWAAVATRQLSLYEAVRTRPQRLSVPRSPRARRELAEAEFGPPADALGGRRPFGLPLLRNSTRSARLLGRLIDAASELRLRR